MKIEIGNGGAGSGVITLLVVGFFIPELFAVIAVLFFIFGFLDWLNAQNVKTRSSSKFPLSTARVSPPLAFAVPRVSPPPPQQMSPQNQESGIRAAIQKATRVSQSGIYEHDERRRIFEKVFLRECQQRAIKISEFKWKRHEPVAVEALLTEPSGESGNEYPKD